MGNQKSVLDLDVILGSGSHYSKNIVSPVYIHILVRKDPELWIAVKFEKESIGITHQKLQKNLPGKPFFVWKPKSKMNDFEVIPGVGRLVKGQTLGVIIIEPLDYYARLSWDKDRTKIVVIASGPWIDEEYGMYELNRSLALGLDVLVVLNDTEVYVLNETSDEMIRKYIIKGNNCGNIPTGTTCYVQKNSIYTKVGKSKTNLICLSGQK